MSMPVRLDQKLVRQATAEAALNRRSTPKQIELWAELGQLIAGKVSSDDLLALTQGLMQLRVDRVSGTPVQTDGLWQQLESDRQSGALAGNVKSGRTVYQAHPAHEGYLEEIRPDGSRRTGYFENGRFVERSVADSAA